METTILIIGIVIIAIYAIGFHFAFFLNLYWSYCVYDKLTLGRVINGALDAFESWITVPTVLDEILKNNKFPLNNITLIKK